MSYLLSMHFPEKNVGVQTIGKIVNDEQIIFFISGLKIKHLFSDCSDCLLSLARFLRTTQPTVRWGSSARSTPGTANPTAKL
jgi:hypothetical protein